MLRLFPDRSRVRVDHNSQRVQQWQQFHESPASAHQCYRGGRFHVGARRRDGFGYGNRQS